MVLAVSLKRNLGVVACAADGRGEAAHGTEWLLLFPFSVAACP